MGTNEHPSKHLLRFLNSDIFIFNFGVFANMHIHVLVYSKPGFSVCYISFYSFWTANSSRKPIQMHRQPHIRVLHNVTVSTLTKRFRKTSFDDGIIVARVQKVGKQLLLDGLFGCQSQL